MMRNHPDMKRLIPTTALRHLYRLLRDFPKEEFHLAVATEFTRLPKKVAKLVAESREHFALYDNRGEAFHRRGPDGVLTSSRLNSKHMADRLVVELVASKDRPAECKDTKLNFRYVDYDIGTLRTPRSEFESGKSAERAGTGGVDLLLSNAHDRTPIVGEIKADTDVNPFFGLIQCLMYAVELSTESQRARLNLSYPERFADGTAAPGIDLYLFLLKYPQDPLSKSFLTLTDQLSASLMADNMLGLGFIRRIVAVESSMSESSSNSFSVAFAHERKRR